MTLKVKKPFSWAHRHVDVKEYKPGEVIDTQDQDLIRVAVEEGWATKAKEPAAVADTETAKQDAAAADPGAKAAAE